MSKRKTKTLTEFKEFRDKYHLNNHQGAYLFSVSPAAFSLWCAKDCASSLARRLKEIIEISGLAEELAAEAREQCKDRRGRPKKNKGDE